MSLLRGRPIAPGYAVGRAFVYGSGEISVPSYRIAPHQIDAEHRRFQHALDNSHGELQQLKERLVSELGSMEAEIFSAHLAFLKDRQLVENVKDYVSRELVNVEQAIEVTIADLAGMLAAVDSKYLQEREQDIRDLGRRLLRHLAGQGGRLWFCLLPESIVVAHEILPSDMMELDRAHVVGLVTEKGGETSHAAILARSLGIPAVTGVVNAVHLIETGMRITVDGQTGVVQFDPSAEDYETFVQLKEQYDRANSMAFAAEKRLCVTQDGERVYLHANINRPSEAAEVEQHNLDGVGLFRTEYMFLDEPEPPGFERQYAAYRMVAETLRNRPLTIRTIDFGGDKRPAFLTARFESNPDLGMRGLRFALTGLADLFRTQLQAFLHLAKDYDVRILFPMVVGGSDLQRALDLLTEIAREQKIDRIPPVGAIIETPSAVFAIQEILDRVDFLNIGTNDLTQYMLAADRNALELMEDYSVLHPAILRAIRTVITAAREKDCPVCLCGEAAGDPLVSCLLIGLGARELSMSPIRAARVRYAVRNACYQELEHLAEMALACGAPEQVKELIERRINTGLRE